MLGAWLAYRATLLPGMDLGDTAALQHAAGDLHLTPRQAYPLYFALANPIAAMAGGEPAFGMNMASAVLGALACGVMVLAGGLVARSTAAGALAGLLLAGSYTFWSQAIIAEVYTLHLLMTGLVLLALLAWFEQPGRARLTLVWAAYALSFGNHLMSVLLAPAILAFLLVVPAGRRALRDPITIAAALACAAGGAALYLWNLSHLWALPEPPATLAEALATFWFDVTKADWRETLVMGVHESALTRRIGLYAFDLRQQVGPTGVILAVTGAVWLFATRWRVGVLLLAAWLPAFLFAYTYNVGDVHVFLLPSHQIVVLWAAAGAAALFALARRATHRTIPAVALGAALVVWPVWRAWDAWPAVDRSQDRRPRAWIEALTAGAGQDALLLADLNWQLQNGLDYYARHIRPELNVAPAGGMLLTVPFLVRDNHAIGRRVLATPHSRDLLVAAYGNLFGFQTDPTVDTRSLDQRLADLPSGTRYVIALLAPYRDLPFDQGELTAAMTRLTGGTASLAPGASYSVIAGRIGRRPLFERRSDRPFRVAVGLAGLAVEVRMASWLPVDTIRRAGFGHVTAGRRHLLTLERGVSFVALDADGRPLRSAYASSLYAPLARFEVLPERPPGTDTP